MNDVAPTKRQVVVAALRELVEALDQRVPHVERVAEARIARESAALHKEAADRIEELAPAKLNLRPGKATESDRMTNDDLASRGGR